MNRAPQQSLCFRRAVYENNWWVVVPPHSSVQYRDGSPSYFRDNPAQLDRIAPWLYRELIAVLDDYLDIFVTQELILNMLTQYHIQSMTFRDRILGSVGAKTDHFIHEFYNFVRLPFDMYGYDDFLRNCQIGPGNSFVYQSSDDDSDVRVVDSPNDCILIQPPTPEVIAVDSDSMSSHDSDVIIRESTPPPFINLVDSDDEDGENLNRADSNVTENNQEGPTSPKVLPTKLKLEKFFYKGKKCQRRKKHDRDSESDSSDSCSSSNSCSTSNNNDNCSLASSFKTTWTAVQSDDAQKNGTNQPSQRRKYYRKYKFNKRRKVMNYDSSDNSDSDESSKEKFRRSKNIIELEKPKQLLQEKMSRKGKFLKQQGLSSAARIKSENSGSSGSDWNDSDNDAAALLMKKGLVDSFLDGEPRRTTPLSAREDDFYLSDMLPRRQDITNIPGPSRSS